METIIESANQFVFYAAGYTLIFVIYGVIIYNLIKFILSVLTSAYKTVMKDLNRWRSRKDK